MSRRNINLERLLCGTVACVSGLYIVTFLVVALVRVGYPFELEWIEGSMAEHVQRVLSGQAIYGPPSIEFKPFMYPPLYYYVSALFAAITGPGLLPLRLVSIASTLGCLYFIYRLVRTETGSAYPGVVAAGLFAALYALSGAWYDVARIDMLHYALLLAGVYLYRIAESRGDHIASALFFTLAIFTKQTGVVVTLPLMLHALLFRRSLGAWFSGSVIGFVGAGTAWLTFTSDGWYLYYNVFVSNMLWLTDLLPSVLLDEVLGPLFLALAFAATYLVFALRSNTRSTGAFYLLLLGGAAGASLSTRLLPGGYHNNMIALYATFAVLCGLGVHEVERRIDDTRWRAKKWLHAGLHIAVLAQLALLAYDPTHYVPSARDRQAGAALVAQLREIPGDVFMPSHGYLATLVGKRSWAHTIPMWELVQWDDRPLRNEFLTELEQAIGERRFGAIVLDNSTPEFIWTPTLKHYTLSHKVFDDADVFWPSTGLRTRPEYVYVPK